MLAVSSVLVMEALSTVSSVIILQLGCCVCGVCGGVCVLGVCVLGVCGGWMTMGVCLTQTVLLLTGDSAAGPVRDKGGGVFSRVGRLYKAGVLPIL